MKSHPTFIVSIALCTFNGERFLQELLDSLSAQIRLPDEVVVGDDGSTDRTLEILERWAKSVVFPVKILKNNRKLGCTGNFLTTMRRCSGDLIFFCDQDDVWSPEKLFKMERVFEERPEVGIVYCDGAIINQNGQDLHTKRSALSQAYMFSVGMPFWNPCVREHNNLTGCCSAFRRTLVESFQFEESPFEHDVWLYNRLLPVTDCVTLHEPLIQYRVHGGNVSLPGNWRDRFYKDLTRQKTFYRWSVSSYWGNAESLERSVVELEKSRENPYSRRFVEYIRENQIHYPNRHRVQRNFFVFFPLFFVEVFTGRYFARFQPVRSMAFDMWTGIKNGLNPLVTLRLVGSLFGKIWRKLKCR